ncbi:hypothetical protein B0H13DRAFT_1936233 [Mycena leptocephala]|nr:hypothetical protein B0H13DRAFT_1936233 [Mycena leptocephala]
MSISSGPTLPALRGTLGSIEIGLVLGTFLFGVLTLQVFNYFRTYTNDTLLLKTLADIVWGLELAHPICAWHSKYILDPPHSIVLLALFSGLLTMVVQYRPGSSLLARQRVPGLEGETEPLDRGHRLVRGSRDQHSDCDFDVLLPEEDSAGSNRVNQNTHNGGHAYHVDRCVISILQVIFFVVREDLLSNCMLASLNGRQRFRSQTAGIITDFTVTNNQNISVIRMNRMGETFDNGFKVARFICSVYARSQFFRVQEAQQRS